MKNLLKKLYIIIILQALLTPLSGVFSSEHVLNDEMNNIVTVYPTGTDDTANLISAFQTVIAGGPGGSVQLVEGEYTISEEIVVVNFDGYFKGAGIHKTIIKNEYTEEWPHRTEKFFPEVASLFLFYQTDELVHNYHISDMMIIVQGKTYEVDTFIGMNVFDIVGRVNGDKTDFYETEFNSHIENVYFQGSEIDAWHYSNTINTYHIGGEFVVTDAWYFKPITGNHVIKNCIFETASGPKANSMNGHLLIENNTINNAMFGGILYDPAGIADESNVVIRNNSISNVKMAGLWLWGMNDLLFENNIIYNSTANGLMLMNSHNNRFINNQITDCAQNGILLDSSSNNALTDNIFEENGVDIFWEGVGGDIIFDGDSINSIMVSNSTVEKMAGLQENINEVSAELENLEAELESERTYVADLGYQLDEASDDMISLEAEFSEAKSEIADLNSQLSSRYSMSYIVMIAVGVAVISGIIGFLISKRPK